jgi:AcrR family transcriptional regulator
LSRPPGSRDKILDVAEALFARRGFASVGLRELAEASGLGKSSLFHHFRSKAQLYYEVLARVLRRIQARLAPVLALPIDARERLDRLLDALVDSLAEQPTTARLLLRSLFEEDDFRAAAPDEAEAVERTIGALLDSIQRFLREGVESGVFRRVSVPHTVQTLIGATVYHIASGELGDELLARPIFSADEVRRRKHEIKQLLHRGLVQPAS